MKTPNLILHNFRLIALLEAVFTVSGANQMPKVRGMEPLPVALLFIGAGIVRLCVYYWLLNRNLRPTQLLQRRVSGGGSILESELRDADAKLQAAPRLLTMAAAIGYAAMYPGIYAVYSSFVGEPETPAFHWEIFTVSSGTALFGAVGVMLPLVTWATAGAAGENHLLAARRGWTLDREPRSIATRLMLLAVCLAGAPAVQIVSTSIAAEAVGRTASIEHEARILAAELGAATHGRGAASSLDAALQSSDRAHTSLFVINESGALHAAGRPLPDWATVSLLRRAAVEPRDLPVRGVSVSSRTLGDGSTVGALVTLSPLDGAFVGRMVNEIFGLIILAVVSAWLLSRSVTLPLRTTAQQTRRAASHGDLSQLEPLPVAQNDEIGVVMLDLNELLDGMRSIADAASAVGDGKLSVDLVGRGELPDAFRRMLDQLQGVVSEMHDTSSELAAAATEIFAASQEQEAASTSHSTGMREIAQTMESLSDSASHVASSVQGVLGNAERTLQNTDRMNARIDDLTAHANRIGDILETIRDIADRTDLLALNGSLEASRAGEAGVGFSLVASEMRRLAVRVTASITDVKSLVSDIRESGASTVVATEESKSLAEATTEAARSIALVTQQQRSSTEQVSQHVRSVAEVVQQAAAATTQTRASADNLKRHAERLTEVVSRFQLTA